MHYTGRLEDGTVFDTSEGRDPLTFTLGEGQVIPGFEEAVSGMEPGESKTYPIEAENAYGDRRDDLVIEVQREQLAGVTPEQGQQLQMRLQDGRSIPVVVREVEENTVTIDANHPLAGQKLIFDIELVEIA